MRLEHPPLMNGQLERYANGRVVARITLSRRNLQMLLQKLNAAITDADRTIWRDLDGGLTVAVTAEDDERHYRDREPTVNAHDARPPSAV